MGPDGVAGFGRVAFDGDHAVVGVGGKGQVGVDGDVGNTGQSADRGQQSFDEGAMRSVVLVVLPRE